MKFVESKFEPRGVVEHMVMAGGSIRPHDINDDSKILVNGV